MQEEITTESSSSIIEDDRIEKMSNEELFNIIDEYTNYSENYIEAKQELLKRLSKNNIEEFKKKLIEEINKICKKELEIKTSTLDWILVQRELIDLINNLK